MAHDFLVHAPHDGGGVVAQDIEPSPAVAGRIPFDGAGPAVDVARPHRTA
jgi:hypothetical protein